MRGETREERHETKRRETGDKERGVMREERHEKRDKIRDKERQNMRQRETK